MRKPFFLVAALFISLLFLAGTVQAAPIVIKIGDSTPKSFSYYAAFVAFEKEVEQKTGGKVDIQYFGEGVLGDQKTLMESTMMGAIQMVTIPSSVGQNWVPELKVFTLPFVWPGYDVLRRFLDGPEGEKLSKLWEKHNLVNLGWGYTGNIGIQNRKRAIKDPEDMKGLKIRTMQDPIMVDTINAMGGMGVAMGLGELYSAVQQGVLDGISTSPQLLHSLKIFEVAKQYSAMDMHYTPACTLVNMNFWKSLPADIQNAMKEAFKNWVRINDDYFRDPSLPTSDQTIFNIYKEKGVTITQPNLPLFKKMTAPVVKKYRQQIGPQFVDSVLNSTGYKLE